MCISISNRLSDKLCNFIYFLIRFLTLFEKITNFIKSKVRMIFEIITIIYTIAYILLFCYEFYIQKAHLYMQTLLFNPFKVVFILSLIATLLMVPMRIACNTYGEDVLLILSVILKSMFILYLGR